MSKHKIHHANIKEWAANYEGELFDAILCDPPYELGFMGKSWDSSGIAFDTEMWADLFKLVKPGGHLLAFSGSRTYHRMAVAIEDAGFEIRDMIEWVYGSGFPKSLNIGKAVDKIQGNEREVLGSYYGAVQNPNSVAGGLNASPNADENGRTTVISTKGTSPYEGYGTALKPAHEPICLARKFLEGTVANNVLKHGTGGLNIDGTRVQSASNDPNHRGTRGFGRSSGGHKTSYIGGEKEVQLKEYEQHSGRFPANLIHDGSDEVEAVFPQSKDGTAGKRNAQNGDVMKTGLGATDTKWGGYGNGGSASRFFYTAKASKSERNAGLENNHPTVKPLSLTRYLATLIKPPTGGRILVPFSGSGSEMIGALQAGWGYVEGVELTEEYIPIAEARLAHWIDHEKSWTPQT